MMGARPSSLRVSARPGAQRGAALLVAMLTVTLVASFAASALWLQWRALEIESADRERMQSGWLLTGALDWAALVLREDGRGAAADHLGEPWALPLQETRLSSFLAQDRNNNAALVAGDVPELFLSGRIEDMQARLNVANLVEGSSVSEADLKIFSKLFELLGLPVAELQALSSNLVLAVSLANGQAVPVSAPLKPLRIAQLQSMGLSPATLRRLTPFVTLLPVRTPLNLNTATPEAIFASVPGLPMDLAQQLVAARRLAHFRTLEDAQRLLGQFSGQVNLYQHGVSTRFFQVSGRLRSDAGAVEERSLLRRDAAGIQTVWRERAAL